MAHLSFIVQDLSISTPFYDLPCQYLLADNRRNDYIDICVPLHNLLMEGDLEAVKGILESHKSLSRYAITENCETVLHIAVASVKSNEKIIKIVRYLVDEMRSADLQLQNKEGNTALSLAAVVGNLEIAEIMVKKNKALLTIPNAKGMMPLQIAVLYGNLDMVDYFYGMSNQMNDPAWTDTTRSWVFFKCIELNFFDFALKILEHHPQVAQNGSALGALARKPSAFNEIKPDFSRRIFNSIFHLKVEPIDCDAIRLLRLIWTSIMEKPKAEIDQILGGPQVLMNGKSASYPSRVLFVAAEMGNTIFLAELFRRYPDLIWKLNEDDQSIFHVAVYHRHESICNLLIEIESGLLFTNGKDQERNNLGYLGMMSTDREGNNVLHMAGMIPEESRLHYVSAEALQLQRELVWFKEVESMVSPLYRKQKNKSGLTPHELFTENHKSLVIESEKWMKETANSCIVVASLIASIVFASAYTIPGGHNQKNGFAMPFHKGTFKKFMVLTVISFILSSASVLVFLSILTSRYVQEDFRESLPQKLLLGLSMLFLSIVTMMVSFIVSILAICSHKFIMVAILVALIPIFSYSRLLYLLLKDVFRATYGSRCLFKPEKPISSY